MTPLKLLPTIALPLIKLLVIILLASQSAFAGSGAGDVMISNAWARASAGAAKNGAAYLTVENQGAQADRLIAVQSDVAGRSELHTHIMENDVAKMRPVEDIEIPAGETVVLQPGGDHVMLMGLHSPLKEGEAFPMTLIFEKAGEIQTEVPIAGVGAQGPIGSMDHDHSSEGGESEGGHDDNHNMESN